MANTHTPGPWAVAEDYDNDGMPETVIRGLDGRAAVAVALDFGTNNPEMRRDNAVLIAAAPDLLAALQGLIRAGHSLNCSSCEWNAAHSAISKATGEQQ